MISASQDDVAWTSLVSELDEAKEHLEKLVDEMVKQGRMDDDEFAVQMGHVYAHLNRAWHSRNQTGEITQEPWDTYSDFPKDLRTVG